MKNLSKKILLLALIAALLAPSLGASAAEKPDTPVYDFSSRAQDEATQTTEEAKVPSVVSGEQTQAPKEPKAEETAAQPKTEEVTTQQAATPSTAGTVTPSAAVKYSSMQASINKYAAMNSSVKGWLYVPNTNMNLPIINPTDKDNFYYEKRTLQGVNYPGMNYKNYVETATYTDYRVVLGSNWASSSKNIVIYGHNWTNLKAPYDIGNVKRHTMFAQLPSYNSIDFARKNPYIYFSTGNMEGVWKIFSVAYIETSAKVFGYNTPNPSAEAYVNTLTEFRNRSIFNFDVDLRSDDHIITLDTCTRNYANVGSGQRFVVVARLLRPGESDTTPVNVTVNNNVKKPKF